MNMQRLYASVRADRMAPPYRRNSIATRHHGLSALPGLSFLTPIYAFTVATAGVPWWRFDIWRLLVRRWRAGSVAAKGRVSLNTNFSRDGPAKRHSPSVSRAQKRRGRTSQCRWYHSYSHVYTLAARLRAGALRNNAGAERAPSSMANRICRAARHRYHSRRENLTAGAF